MADISHVEFYVLDAAGEYADWLTDRNEAIAAAQKLGGSVERVTHYCDSRLTIFVAARLEGADA